MKRRILLLGFIIAIFLLPSVNAGVEYRITAKKYDQIHPAIDGNRIIWLDEDDWGLYLYDMDSSETTKITDRTVYLYGKPPIAIYGDYIAYIGSPDVSDNTYHLFVYKLSTSEETDLNPLYWPQRHDDLVGKKAVDIYGNYVIWVEGIRYKGSGLFMFDLTTNKLTKIAQSVSGHIDIYEDKIVWDALDEDDGRQNIYLYDISTSKTTRITDGNTTSGTQPRIYGEKIVYTNVSWIGVDIFKYIMVYDMSTSEHYQLTTGSSPNIYGDRIVYPECKEGKCNIVVTDLDGTVKNKIDASLELPINIYEDKIVWSDHRNDVDGMGYDIYLYDLSAIPPDSDDNGIIDENDNCPTEPENFNEYQDEDGCPDVIPTTTPPPTTTSAPTTPPTQKIRIVVLANSIDYGNAESFFGFLKNIGIDVIHSTAADFEQYKNEKFIVILGGPDAYDGIGEIVQEILTEDEQNAIREKGNRKKYTKINPWKLRPGQRVTILAGSDRIQTKKSHEENKEEVSTEVES